jgi:hypothetical protein
VDEIEFPITGQSRPGKIAAAHDANKRRKPISKRQHPLAVTIEKVTLRVQKSPLTILSRFMPQIQLDLHLITPQETDNFLDKPLCFLSKWLGVEFISQIAFGVSSQAHVLGSLRFIAEQQPEAANGRKRMPQQRVASDAEIGRRYIDCLAGLRFEETIQHVRKLVRNIVNDKRYAHLVFRHKV